MRHFSFLIFSLMLSSVALGQSEAQFLMEALKLEVQNPKNLVVISDDGPSLIVKLKYEGRIEAGMRLKGSLAGPGMSAPLFIDQPAESLSIEFSNATFQEEGEFLLTGVRLEKDSRVIATANPQVTTIEVVDSLLVTGATVEEVSKEELEAQGFAFNNEDYRAVKFNVNLVMGRDELLETFTLMVPTPKEGEIFRFRQKDIEVVHNPFRADRPFKMLTVRFRENMKQSPFEHGNYELEPEWDGVDFEGYELYSLLLVPGELSYFKGHFNVVALVLNDTPDGFDVRVSNLEAEMQLPDPNRYGYPLKILDQNGNPVRDVIRSGEDNNPLTANTANYLGPGEDGKASFLLTGEQPGMWDVQIDIKGQAALPQGNVDVKSSTNAKILVRSREFAVSFEHPATVAELQDYDFKMNIFNKSSVPLEGFTVTLDPETLIGTELQATTDPQQSIATIPPGETGTITFGMRSIVTGTVAASYHRVHDGSDSSLALSVGVGNDGETLTHFSVAFPERFDEVVPPQLNQAFRVYAKKLIDFAQTEPELLPAGVSAFSMGQASTFFKSISSAALFLDWVSDDLGNGYHYDSDTALFSMLTTYLNNQRGQENIDGLRRHLLETSNDLWDLELAFSQILQTRMPAMNAQSLLERISYESDHLAKLRLMVLQGNDLNGLEVVTGSGLKMSGVDANKVRDIPYSGMFRLASDQVLIWTATDEDQVNVVLPDSASQVNLTALLTDQQKRRHLAHPLSLSQDQIGNIEMKPDGILLVRSGEGQELNQPTYTSISSRPFALVGIRQLDPTYQQGVDRFNQHNKRNELMENGRWFLLAFSEPVDMNSLHPLQEHFQINGQGARKAYLQSDPRLITVLSSQIVGNNFPIEYFLQNVQSRKGIPLVTGPTQGTFLGSNWLRGSYIRGRITDHHGTDLSKAKVFLTMSGGDSGFPTDGINLHKAAITSNFLDVTDVAYDGTYQLDFIRHNRKFIADMAKRETESGVPAKENVAQVVALLEDGRFKPLTFYPLTSGQEVRGDIVFSQLGKVWGEVRNQAGELQPGVDVYVHNQLTFSGARLVKTDENGVYELDGIEVGPIAVRTAIDGFVGMATGYMTISNNPLRLDLQPMVERGDLVGRITIVEDGVERGVPNAAVAYSPHAVSETSIFDVEGVHFEAYAFTYTNEDGYYYLPSIPAGLAHVQAVLSGVTTRIQTVIVEPNTETTLNMAFQGDVYGGYVRGRVFNVDGTPAANVEVWTLDALYSRVDTETDESGYFELAPVLMNQNVKIQARKPNGQGFWNIGNYFLTLTEENPTRTDLEIHLQGETEVQGHYTDFQGDPLAYRQLAMFSQHFGYYQMNLTDQEGNFTGRLRAGSAKLWAIGASYFPRITYQSAFILPGEINQVNVREWGYESIKARLIDGHGNPVIGRIVVESILPDTASGMGVPAKIPSHTYFSDLNAYTTFKDINYGSVTIYGIHPILGTTQRYTFIHGENVNREDLRQITLSFPRSEPGRLHGFVFNDDGTPAPAGTLVHATFSGVKATTLCNEGGYYNFTSLVSTIQPKSVELFANHVESDRYASKTVVLNQNLNMRADLILKGEGSLTVRVIDSDGAPVENGDLIVKYQAYSNTIPDSVANAIAAGNYSLDAVPAESIDEVIVNQTQRVENVRMDIANPFRVFTEIPAGSISVRAESGAGLAGFAETAIPISGGDVEVVVRLEAGSTIRGIFVDEYDQPITDAQIDFSHRGFILGSVTTDSPGATAGQFEITGLPMRNYGLRGYQPDTNFEGVAEVMTSPFDPEPFVTVKLNPLGHIEGIVMMESTGEPAVSANVTLYLDRFRKLETATDENGYYRYENLPLGDYALEVSSLFVPGASSTNTTISTTGEVAQANMILGQGFDLIVNVVDSDGGLLPNAVVIADGITTGGITNKTLSYVTYADNNSVAEFKNLPRGNYKISSNINDYGKTVAVEFELTGNRESYEMTLQMPSLFTVRGNVKDSLGMVPSRRVTVSAFYELGNEDFIKTATIDSNGDYEIPGLPYFDSINVFAHDRDTGNTASHPAFSHTEDDGLEKVVDLTLAAVTTATGVVLNASGDPVANAQVWIRKPLTITTYTDAAGQFTLYPYIDGSQTIFAKDPDSPRMGATLAPVPDRISSGLLPVTDQVIVLQPMFDIEGVVRLNDGTPIIGVEVSAVNQETGAKFTIPGQDQGYYFLENLPAGTYDISAYDIIRREHLATPATVTNDVDNALIQQDLTFQENFFVAGRVFNALDQGEPNAVVEIFREIERFGRTGFFLVDTTETNEDGFFDFGTLYPGQYRIRAENSLQSLSKSVEFTLGSANREDISLNLKYESSLLVSAKSPENIPYQNARLDLFRGGRLWQRLSLFSDGTVEIPRLTTEETTYQLIINNGWSTTQGVFNLQPGPNFYELIGPSVVKLSGIAIYQNEAGGVPSVNATVNQAYNPADILADGYFEIDQIPVNQPVTITLAKGSSKRTIEYAGFSQDSDLGTLLLNGGPPVVTPVLESLTVSSLPHTFEFETTHAHDPEAVLDPSKTRVTLGYTMIGSEDIQTIGTRIYVTLTPEKAAYMARGEYYLQINAAREDGLTGSYHEYIQIAPVTTTILVNASGLTEFGSYSLDRGQTWQEAVDPDQIVVQSAGDSIHLLVRDPFHNQANRLDLDLDPTYMAEVHSLTMRDYAGVEGTVYLPDGITPAAGVRVSIVDYWDTTDVNGQYLIDYVPQQYVKNSTFIVAQQDPRFGATKVRETANLFQIVNDNDIVLKGRGQLEILGYMSDGLTPALGAEFTLTYTNHPTTTKVNDILDDQGRWVSNDVIATDFTVSVYHPASGLRGTGTGSFTAENTSQSISITLEPTYQISGIVVDDLGLPLDGAIVEYVGQSSIYHQSTTTDASGNFTLDSIPVNQSVILRAIHVPSKRSGKQSINNINTNVDLGNWELTPDLPPSVTNVVLPEILFVGARESYQIVVQDDYGLKSLNISLSGAHTDSDFYNSTWALKSSPINQGLSSSVLLPSSATPGLLTVTLTLEDQVGNTITEDHTINYVEDLVGPQITVNAPLTSDSFMEGTYIPFDISATDPNGVDRIEVLWQGNLFAVRNGGYPLVSDVLAVGVDAATAIDYQVLAYDRAGNVTELLYPVNITPQTTTNAPLAQLQYPLDGMPLPMSTVNPLNIPIRIHAEDQVALQRYELQVEGELIASGWLLEQQDQDGFDWELPSNLASLSQVTFTLSVWNVGDQMTQVQATVHNIEGAIFDASNPLNLVEFDNAQGDQTLILNGGAHHIDGPHEFTNFIMVNGASLTQRETNVDENWYASTELTIENHFVLSPESQIDLVGKGFYNTPPFVPINAGANHGGSYATYNDLEGIYGSIAYPTLPGTAQGGGYLSLTAPSVWLAGSIVATSTGGYGSGGSIAIYSSQNLAGFGHLNANGYAIDHTAGTSSAGGRIAIHANQLFKGKATAYTKLDNGAGSIYQRIADPSYADGYREILSVQQGPNYSSNNSIGVTPLIGIRKIKDATVTVEFNVQDAPEYATGDVIRFDANLEMPKRYYRGFEVWIAGSRRGLVTTQRSNDLWLEPNSLGQVNEGDLIEIRLPLDEIHVSKEGALLAVDHPIANLTLSDSGMLVGIGQTHAESLIIDGHGDLIVNDFYVPTAVLGDQLSLGLIGHFGANQFTVATDASISMMNSIVFYQWDDILTDNQLQPNQIAGFGFFDSIEEPDHGGLYYGGNVIGSPYQPQTHSYATHMRFSVANLNLDGIIHNSKSNYSGSIWIEGQTLTGSGTLSVNGAENGGRLAIDVDHVDAFTGTATAFSDRGGAGTVFWRTASQPKGRLVIDNGGKAAPAQSTYLDGVGLRTLSADLSGSAVTTIDLPDYNALAGMYLVIDDGEPIAITENTTTEIQLATDLPQTYTAGTTYRGRHVLDELVLAGGASFDSLDPIYADKVTYAGGTSVAEIVQTGDGGGTFTLDQGGNATFDEDPGFSDYVVDNATLTLNFPLNAQSLILRNSATVQYRFPMNVSDIQVTDSTVIGAIANAEMPAIDSFAVTASTLTMQNATWRSWMYAEAPQGTDWDLNYLSFDVQQSFSIDATSVIGIMDQNEAIFGNDWYGQNLQLGGSHGGITKVPYVDWYNNSRGSYAKPRFPGIGSAIRIQTQNLHLDGELRGALLNKKPGGSVWIETQTGTGTGRVVVADASDIPGGRIAIHYGNDGSFIDQWELKAHSDSDKPTNAAGTIFLKSTLQTHGTLIVDQGQEVDHQAEHTRLSTPWKTGIAGIKSITTELLDEDNDPLVVRDRSWDQLPFEMSELWARFHIEGVDYELQIDYNTPNTLVFKTPSNGVLPPDQVPVGTQFDFVLKLDRIELLNGAILSFDGIVQTQELIADAGPHANGIHCADLELPSPYTLANADLMLWPIDGDLSDLDLILQDSKLWTAIPFSLNSLEMINSTVTHPDINYSTNGFGHAVDLTIQTLTMDATSVIDVSEIHQYYRAGFTTQNGYGSPGHRTSAVTYGSFLRPYLPGSDYNSGGRIRIIADTINGATMLANGKPIGGTGGSIWLEAQTMTGTIDLQANSGGSTSSGGAGRIAIYAQDTSSATINPSVTGMLASGTVLTRYAGQTYGTLSIPDQPTVIYNGEPLPKYNPLPSFGVFQTPADVQVTYDAGADQSTVTLTGWTDFDNFSGYELVIGDANPVRHTILDHQTQDSTATFILAGEITNLTVGTPIRAGATLDAFNPCVDCIVPTGPLSLRVVSDTTAPQIQVFGLATGRSWIDSGLSFDIAATVQDDIDVDRVVVDFNGQQYVAYDNGDLVLNATAPVVTQDTLLPLTLTVFDTNGNQTTTSENINIVPNDVTAPSIALVQPASQIVNGGSDMNVEVNVTDNRMLQSVTFDFNGEQQFLETDQTQGVYTATFAVPISGGQASQTLTITAVDDKTNQTITPFTITIEDVTPPEEVTGLSSDANEDSITWSWTAPANNHGDLSAIHVYVDGSLTPEVLAPTATDYTLGGLSPSTWHDIRVSTIDNLGNESPGLTNSAATTQVGGGGLLATPQVYFPMDQPIAHQNLADIGVSDHFQAFGVQNGLVGKTGFTVATWVKANAPHSNYLFEMLRVNGTSSTQFAVIYSRTNGALAQIKRATGSYNSLNAAFSHNDGAWYRLVLTVDFANLVMKMYHDGVEIGTRTLTSNSAGVIDEDLNSTFLIGGRNASYGQWTGHLFDFQLWDHAWAPEDVQYDAADVSRLVSERPGSTVTTNENLLGRWLFNQGPNQTILDYSGGGFTGTTYRDPIQWFDENAPAKKLSSVATPTDWLHPTATMAQGRYGSAMALRSNTVDPTVTPLSVVAPPPFANTWTLNTFFYLEELPSSALKAANLLDMGSGEPLKIQVNASDQLFLDWTIGSQVVGTALNANTWYQLTLTVNNNVVQVYLDGLAYGDPITMTNWSPTHFTWRSGGDTAAFRLDELAYWNSGFGPAEVQMIAQAYADGKNLTEITPLVNAAEVVNIQVNATSAGAAFNWSAPDFGQVNAATGYRLYINGSPTPVELTAPTTQYTYAGHVPTADMTYRLTTLYGESETQGITGTLKARSTPVAPSGISVPETHWDLESPRLGQAKLVLRNDNYLQLPQPNTILDGASEATVSFWFRGEQIGVTRYLFFLSHSSGSNSPVIEVYQNNQGRITAAIRRTTGSTSYLSTTNQPQDNKWHKIQITANWNTGEFNLYYDGELLKSLTNASDPAGPISTGPSTKMILGAYRNGSVKFDEGTLHDVQVWNKVFDAQDLAFDYSNYMGLPTERPGTSLTNTDLRAHWLLSGDDTSLNDLSGNGNNLTATGTNEWEIPTIEPMPNLVDVVQAATFTSSQLFSSPGQAGQGLTVANKIITLQTPVNWQSNAGFSASTFLKVNSEALAGLQDTQLFTRETTQGNLDLRITGSGYLKVKLPNGIWVTADQAVNLNGWIHVTLTFAPDGDLTIYLNGHPYLDVADSGAWDDALNDWILAGDGLQTRRSASGSFDEITAWNRVLTSAEVAAIFDLYSNNDTLTNALGLGTLPAPLDGGDDQGSGETDGGLAEGKGSSLPEGTEQLDEKTWELRHTDATMGDLIVDGDFWLIGGRLTITGQIQARSIYLRDGAVLTVPPQAQSMQPTLRINLSGSLDVDARSHINLDGVSQHQSVQAPNLAHAAYAMSEDRGQLQGAILMPQHTGGGLNGGGAFYLQAHSLKLDGQLSARGLQLAAGGSIWLNLNQLSGLGVIDVSGGQSDDVIASGGRVAIYSDTYHQFSGQIITGLNQNTAGSLIMAKPDGSDLIVDRSFPWQRRLPELPTALSITPNQVEPLGRNGLGELLKVTPGTDLNPYKGAWVDTQTSRARIMDVIDMGDGSYLVQLQGEIHNQTWHTLTFVIQAQHPQSQPQRMPLVPKR